MHIKNWLVVVVLLAFGGFFIAVPSNTAPRPTLKSERERASYAFGVDLAPSLQQTHGQLEPGAIRRGLRDALAGRNLRLTPSEINAALAAPQPEATAMTLGSKSGSVWNWFSFGSEREKRSYAIGETSAHYGSR